MEKENKRKEITLHHWDFYESDGLFICYDNREGDTWGHLAPGEEDVPQTLEGLEQYLSDYSEEDLYQWLTGSLEFY